MTTEELLRDRLSDAVGDVEARDITVDDIAGLARRQRRRQRSALGAIGVVTTAAIVGVTAALLPGEHPASAPAPASPQTSQQLLDVVQPTIEKVLAAFHVAPVSIVVSPDKEAYDPSVWVQAGPPLASKFGASPTGAKAQELSFTITQHPSRIDPATAGQDIQLPGEPKLTTRSGTWPGGIRYTSWSNSVSSAIHAELPADITVLGGAEPIVTAFNKNGTMTFRANPLAGVVDSATKALAQGLPPIAHLAAPPQLPWVIGPNDAALTALQKAAAKAPDVASTAKVLYFRAKVVDTRNENDVEEVWIQRDNQSGSTFSAGVQYGKEHAGYYGGGSWNSTFGSPQVDWNGLKTYPTGVAALEQLAYKTFGEHPPGSYSLFTSIEGMVQESPASPRLQASLAVLAGRLPGTTVNPHAKDPLGRPAVAILLGGIYRMRLLFSPSTGTFLASEELTKTGTVLQYRAITEVASVRATRIRPDGSTPQPLKKR